MPLFNMKLKSLGDKFFEATEEQEKAIDDFMAKYNIKSDLKGYKFFKTILIYTLNTYKITYYIEDINDLYVICSKYLKTTPYNVRRQCEYTLTNYFRNHGNKSVSQTPKNFLYKAVHEIEFKEELDTNVYKRNKI